MTKKIVKKTAKNVKDVVDEFPHIFICGTCAHSKGGKWPKGHCATCHVAKCGYCNQIDGLSNIGDWDWPDRKPRGMRD